VLEATKRIERPRVKPNTPRPGRLATHRGSPGLAVLADSRKLQELLARLARTGIDYRQRAVAVDGIVQGWAASPSTRTLLRDRADNDTHRLVRQTAMIAIRDHWPSDAATLSLLQRRAADDPAKDVCQTPLSRLAMDGPRSQVISTCSAT
jgi:hypothetical protein